MNITIGGRGSGRTTELIKACAQNKGTVIVAPYLKDAKRIANMAKEMGLDIPEPITFWEFCWGKTSNAGEYVTRENVTYYTKKYSGFYFDDLERSLQCMIYGKQILDVSIEGEPNDILWLDHSII